MRKIFCLFLAMFLCISLIGCDEDSHEGELKPPKTSSELEGQNYEDVVQIFEGQGFTNIKIEPIEDLILGWFTKDGEVEEVSVGGDVEYSKNKWVAADIEVIIRYHTFPSKEVENPEPSNPVSKPEQESKPAEQESNITIENNTDFAALMKITDQTDTVTIRNFANAYKGKVIEFSGCVAFMMQHGSYTTRFDVCLANGNYDERVYGPFFAFENVNFYDMNVSGTDTVAGGMLFRIAGKIIGFSEEGEYIILEPVFMKAR